MDTNVKKWTDLLWVKLTALLLSILCFVGMSAVVFYAYQQITMFSEIALHTPAQKQQLLFTDNHYFYNEFVRDVESVALKTGNYVNRSLQEYLASEQENKTENFVKKFNTAKADFIRSYLFDCLCQEDIYENYETYFLTDAQISVPQITIEKRVLVDAYAPEFVQKLQKILNGTDGTGFLRYESLIPRDVLAAETRQSEINISWNEYGFGKSFEYHLDLENPYAYFQTLYEETVAEIDVSGYIENSFLPQSIQYYIHNPKTKEVFTNTTFSEKEWLGYYQKNTVGFSIVGGKTEQKGLDYVTRLSDFSATFNEALDVYVVLDTATADQNDKYVRFEQDFMQMTELDFEILFAMAALMGILSVTLLIFLLVCTQKKCIWIDKIPVEIHLATSIATGALIIWLGAAVVIQVSNYYFKMAGYVYLLFAVFLLLAAMGWGVVCEFFCSLLRIVKSKQLRKRMLLLRIPCWIYRKCRQAFSLISYRPGTMRRYVIPLVIGWTILDILLIVLMIRTKSSGVALLFMVLQFVAAFTIMDYLQQLDKIIVSVHSRQEYTGNEKRLPPSLRVLLQSQKYTQEELKSAIEKAIKDERTKAELITNVSHDLKTPLTSVINYIDLLQRCDMPDDTAREYLSVLEDKSGRLKRLIEDLIEASKVSTGNIVLQKTQLSLSELADQAIVEETESMEAQGLTVIYNTQASPTVFADGSKIYRVFENLLSNARKYSLSGTRVYASVYEDEEFGYFELKNTSKEPLDMDPQELMGRFVRGDRSRSEEGNGLGLSIAGDLCTLNGGELILSIDGDLFKAIVKLPKC